MEAEVQIPSLPLPRLAASPCHVECAGRETIDGRDSAMALAEVPTDNTEQQLATSGVRPECARPLSGCY